jgi:hypothetical protein
MATTATKDSKELYSGKANALTFEKFDEKVIRCAGNNLVMAMVKHCGKMN